MSKSKYYILDGKTPRGVDDVIEWAKSFENSNRIVAQTDVSKDVRVSTVFLGIDHDWTGTHPELFETMIFGGDFAEDCWRYSTWDEAEKGHAEAVTQAQSPAEPPAEVRPHYFAPGNSGVCLICNVNCEMLPVKEKS